MMAAVGIMWLAGCDVVLCRPEPTEQHGVCDPSQSVCGGGGSAPEPDTLQDAAVDIDLYAPQDIPTRVVLRVPNEGRLHVLGDTVLSYLHNPPASGPHFDTPAETGYYCGSLNVGHWVHSLEHGYVVLLFDERFVQASASKGLLSLLPLLFPPSPNFGNVKLVVAPYNGLTHAFCLVSWNRQYYLDDLDLTAMSEYYVNYIDRGPEFIP